MRWRLGDPPSPVWREPRWIWSATKTVFIKHDRLSCLCEQDVDQTTRSSTSNLVLFILAHPSQDESRVEMRIFLGSVLNAVTLQSRSERRTSSHAKRICIDRQLKRDANTMRVYRGVMPKSMASSLTLILACLIPLPSPSEASAKPCFLSCISAMRWSTLSTIVRRSTWTGRVCPMRWQRSNACASTLWDH